MKSRDEAHDCVRACIAKIYGDTGKYVRNFVTDRSTEFTSKRTQDYLMNMRIAHIVSAPHTPEQNGSIERENRTAMNSVRSMLRHNNLPDVLWGEALNTAIYVLNRVPNTKTSSIWPCRNDNKKDIGTCFRCDRSGHFARDCYSKTKKDGSSLENVPIGKTQKYLKGTSRERAQIKPIDHTNLKKAK